MGALPKNKITRAERGKRRAGNTPSLKKVVKHSTVARHKAGLVNQFLQKLGLQAQTAQPKASKKVVAPETLAQAEKDKKAATAVKPRTTKARSTESKPTVKKMRRGQHK